MSPAPSGSARSRRASSSYVRQVTSSDWITIGVGVGGVIVGAILAALISWHFYSRGKARAVLGFVTHTEEVMPKPDKEAAAFVEIRWAGDIIVDSISRLTVGFVNRGNQTLSGFEITEIEPLRIAPRDSRGGIQMLSFGVKAVSRVETRFDVQPHEAGVAVEYDFLEPTDWALLEVLHSGDPGSLEVRGTVRGVSLEHLGTFDPRDPWPPSRWGRRQLVFGWIGLVSLGLLGSVTTGAAGFLGLTIAAAGLPFALALDRRGRRLRG